MQNEFTKIPIFKDACDEEVIGFIELQSQYADMVKNVLCDISISYYEGKDGDVTFNKLYLCRTANTSSKLE